MSHPFTPQLFKAYDQYLRAYISGTGFEKIQLRGGKQRPAITADLHEAIRYFSSYEKSGDKKGWTIEWESWKSKRLGVQQWPAVFSIDTPGRVDLSDQHGVNLCNQR